jgi:SAM-dependent methyltransferase
VKNLRSAIGTASKSQVNWAIRRRLKNELGRAFSQFAHGRLVDIGCGRKPYEKVLRPMVTSHVGVDRADSPHGTSSIDVFGDATDTTLPAESADTVIMTQVLEHLESPSVALSECARILVPEGNLILSTDFAWHLHEAPRDFFRYSEFGLRHLLDGAGFDVVQIRPVAGTWLTTSEEIAYGFRRVAQRHLWFGPFALIFGHLAQVLGTALDALSFDPTLTSGYVAVGKKRIPTPSTLTGNARRS